MTGSQAAPLEAWTDGSGAAIVSSSKAAATVYGVHGAAGTSFWKCLVRGSILHSELEAFEYARLPAGAISGEHRHTRTDEIYFIVTGCGEVSLDGERRRVRAGDLVLTPLGARHALTNTGEDDLEWLVVEVTHPRTAALLPRWSPDS